MIRPPLTIPRQPVLPPAADFFRLRREGVGFIEQMGSQLWTDYNLHDPGITILEALCYAITDLGYRLGWDIRDLLTPATPAADIRQPYPNQAFFTAREILTVNPATPDDFRRLLIDLDLVRNAWVACKQCACEVPYYAWCEDNQLVLGYRKPADPKLEPQRVDPRGLYDILLELEADPVLGDLNDRKIEQTVFVRDSQNRQHPLTLELRFPATELLSQDQMRAFTAFDAASQDFTRQLSRPILLKLARSKTEATIIGEAELLRYWREVFYVSLEIPFDSGPSLVIENAALRFFGNEATQQALQVKDPLLPGFQYTVEDLLCQLPADSKTLAGFVPQYRWKLHLVAGQVAAAKALLHSHRNLDEDYCRISGVAVEDVSVCADVEVAPGADIERVQAQIWFELEQYFNPPVPFYSLPEMLDAGMPVEEIFNGPALNNGFLKAADLAASGLKTVLRTSDILNRLMDIEGVVAVNHLLLAKYDAAGNVVTGAADPTNNAGSLVFDAGKSSAAWQLFVSPQHQPRLYHRLSRFLFFRDGLPFLPRTDEAYDTLTQLRGEAARPKIPNAPKDLPVPPGSYRSPEEYLPLQHSFPQTYGIGPEGLPSHASLLRRGQARQLKAYLLVFEQVLANAFAQLAHTADLFSLDPATRRTYFVRELSQQVLAGYGDLVDGLDTPALESLTETTPEFQHRRNRFLDHLLARFGENFGEYALLLTHLQGQQVGLKNLIDDKLFFLKAYPGISHDRGKAFDYTRDIGSPENVPGLKRRVSLLLGYPDLAFAWMPPELAPELNTVTGYQLQDKNGAIWLVGSLSVTCPDQAAARQQAYRELLGRMVLAGAYQVQELAGGFQLGLQAKNGDPLGLHPTLLASREAAEALQNELLGWSSQERALLVEHLLLRPKFPGDALLPACVEGPCQTCGGEDPYSFRLTFVMAGWTAPFNVNMDLRRFADRTIRQETPAHLLAKICWVGNDGFIPNPCDLVIGELAALLENQGRTAGGNRPDGVEACACAGAIYTAYSQAFGDWYGDKTLDFIAADALKTQLAALFNATVLPAAIACTTVLEAALWQEVQGLMLDHFVQTAEYGWQFERFEAAWLAWLRANAAFDWPEERLQERVSAILESSYLAGAPANQALHEHLCSCAAGILSQYGTDFYTWMDANLKAGNVLDGFTPFSPAPVVLCPGLTFRAGTAAAIEALLQDRYQAYTAVSYRLWVLGLLLDKLRNTYPGATLHDCDEGSDQNPVRLGSTALGNYPLQRGLTTPPVAPPTPPEPPTEPESPEPVNAPEPPKTPPRPPKSPAKPKDTAKPVKPAPTPPATGTPVMPDPVAAEGRAQALATPTAGAASPGARAPKANREKPGGPEPPPPPEAPAAGGKGRAPAQPTVPRRSQPEKGALKKPAKPKKPPKNS